MAAHQRLTLPPPVGAPTSSVPPPLGAPGPRTGTAGGPARLTAPAPSADDDAVTATPGPHGAPAGAGGAPPPAVPNHLGVCVTELDRARRFYEGALGFRFWWELRVPDGAVGRLLQLQEPIGLHAVYLVLDGLVLELLHYEEGTHPPARRRTMDDPGLTHLSLAVDDLAAAVDRVRAHGGSLVEGTDLGAAAMVRDPDGQLIELTTMQWRAGLPPPPG